MTAAAGSTVLDGGEGSDTFNYTFSPGLQWGLDEIAETGVSGTDTLDFSGTSVDLIFTIDANSSVQVADTGTNQIGNTGGIESVKGGTQKNTFRFLDGATINGTITGGAGTDVLDYSAYTTAVTVDLSLAEPSATGTLGVSGIDDVTGGSGDDVITGDANANVIDGGAGSGHALRRGRHRHDHWRRGQ